MDITELKMRILLGHYVFTNLKHIDFENNQKFNGKTLSDNIFDEEKFPALISLSFRNCNLNGEFLKKLFSSSGLKSNLEFLDFSYNPDLKDEGFSVFLE